MNAMQNRFIFNMVLLGALANQAYSQTTHVNFEDPSWNLSDAVGAMVVEYNGRQSLYVERGSAILNGVDNESAERAIHKVAVSDVDWTRGSLCLILR